MADRGGIKPGDAVRGLPTEQKPDAPPVVSAPSLPAMEKIGAVKTVARNPLLPLMGSGSPPPTGGIGRMDPISTQKPPGSTLPEKPQQPIPQAAPTETEGYLRMEVHYDNGKLSVVGVKRVPGPLGMPSGLIRGYVYEVLLNDQEIGLGSLPDVGVQRAFANSTVEGPQGKHHFAKLPTFDFFVRIPVSYVSTENLPKLQLVLHNVEDAPDRLTNLAPLGTQPGVKTTEVGRLAGIQLDQLSPTVRRELEPILTVNK
ncbi:MAG TPA: hypothetical protein VGR96_03675 [Acidobacteriaceae bacterium]|nr:hypothetical protein [Acidobacteriaceae bacterium]